MTDEEIRQDYREARDKAAQVQILADRNVVSKRAMEEKLYELGLIREPPKPAGRRRGGRKPSAEPLDEIRAMELWREGRDDVAISEALGTAVTRIRDWRARMHLTKKMQRKLREETMEEEQTETVETAETPAETGSEKENSFTVTQTQAKPMDAGQLAALFSGASKVFGSARVTVEGSGTVVGARLDIRYDAESGGLCAADMTIRLIAE